MVPSISFASQWLTGVQTSKSSHVPFSLMGSHIPVAGLQVSHSGTHSGTFSTHSPVSKSHPSVQGLPSVSGHCFTCGKQNAKFVVASMLHAPSTQGFSNPTSHALSLLAGSPMQTVGAPG